MMDLIDILEPSPPHEPQEETGELFLARFKGAKGTIDLDGSPEEVVLHGEFLVAGQTTDDRGLVIKGFRRVALRSQPLTGLEGAISLIGPTEEPGLSEEAANFFVNLYYPRLSTELDPACEDNDAVYPLLERMFCQLTWSAEAVEEGDSLLIEITSLTLDLDVSHLGIAQHAEFAPFRLYFRPMGTEAPPPSEGNSLLPCAGPAPGGTGHTHWQLNVRFVNVSSSVSNATLEPLIKEWIKTACRVWWEKGGIKIAPQSTIDSGSFHSGSVSIGQETDIVQPPPVGMDHDPDRIDIYLVDELDDSRGGGVTHACGSSDAYILLEIETARHDKSLLAHELGHVFGLRHPGPPSATDCTNYREGSFCSVMVPGKPKSFRNTENNVGVIEIPSYPLVPLEFQSLGYLGGWNLDAEQGFFHIVRDFPYDDGTEPSQPETPFTDWWSDSDIWNSNMEPSPVDPQALYDDGSLGTPIFNDDHSPIHTEPSCIGTNYMYVRLHACQPLAHSVNVDLYLADPGVSPGSAQLVPLKPTSINPTNHRLVFHSLEVGPAKPFVKHLEWLWSEVPAGYPKNCCVFAIAHSTHEAAPFADPTAITFADIFPLLGQDNDIAQRNLHVQPCTPTGGAPFWSALPWVQIANPTGAPGAARVEIDSTLAPALEGLTLKVGDGQWEDLHADGSASIPLTNSLGKDQHLVLRLEAMLPPPNPELSANAELEREFPIDLRFFVDDRLVTGYRHLLRVAPLSETVAQVLDSLFGALRDVRAGCLVEGGRARAVQLQDGVRELVVASAAEPEEALQGLSALSEQIADLAQSLSIPANGDECLAVREHLSRLGSLVATREGVASANHLAEQIRDLADRIQEPAGRLARRRQAV